MSAGGVREPVEFLTLPRERRLIEPQIDYDHDVTYADVDEYQNGKGCPVCPFSALTGLSFFKKCPFIEFTLVLGILIPYRVIDL